MNSEPNPYAAALAPGKRPHAAVLVIFGASGDLTKRKLIPALSNLALAKRLPERFAVVGYARSNLSHEAFRDRMRDAVTEFSRTGLKDESAWREFAANLYYVTGEYEDPTGYRKLKEFVDQFDRGVRALPVRVLYLAIPPDLYAPVVQQVAAVDLVSKETDGEPRTRVVFEKPFGSDLESARELNRRIHEVLDEKQVYRIDHYLGKETVQNIMVFRFANSVFEPIWNRRYVDHVQITAGETVGVENRGGYYDRAGAMRDMVQNHLLQLLCLTAMEPPVGFSADAVRDEKMKLLRAVRPVPGEEVPQRAVRGQYGRSRINGKEVPAYREEEGVAQDSHTETYAAIKFRIDNWRWQGVPFYLRSGKAMSCRTTQIVIQFREPPQRLFATERNNLCDANRLIIQVQPAEGIQLHFQTKVPDAGMKLRTTDLTFNYCSEFGRSMPEAYERLLLDALEGDASLFARADEVEAAWRVCDPILNAWQAGDRPPLLTYEPGAWGPEESAEWMRAQGREWFDTCPVLA